MKPAAMAVPPWSRRKWWGVVLGVFALQVLLLIWFSARGSSTPRPISPAPRLQFAGRAAATELLALTDPMLFAQGSPHGFSGASWMRIPVPEYQPPEWTEAPRLLALNARQLGADFRRFVRTNQPFTAAFIAKPSPRLTVSETEESPPATGAPSALRIEGDLSGRGLQSPLALPPPESADLLTDSVVQVLVNGDGNVVSGVLLASSGKRAADERALALAKAAQFQPLPRTNAAQASTHLTRGTFVFTWQTVPLPTTNTPSAHP
jgi:TonB family protein